jgi:formylglycine-generating enzyme required for sulfatase activity
VAEWRRFARATGYLSEAEQTGRGRMFVLARDAWEWIDGLSWATPIAPGDSAPDSWPAVQVTPADAEAFCRWLGGRLPTEVEWERAARGGEDDRIHVWGDDPRPFQNGRPQVNGPDRLTLGQFPRWKGFTDYTDGYATLAPVGTFPANGSGLEDMAGNVYEWTADSYDSTAYRHSSNHLPYVPAADTSLRVVRGGGWGYEPDDFRISFRGFFEARDFWTATVGFRCVRDSAP